MKKVLVIDDDLAHRRIIEYFLKKENVEMHSFEDSEKAFEWLKLNDVDIMLIDIQLPGMSGVEILREVRAIKKFDKSFCIAFTALDFFEDKLVNELGFDCVIRKPVNPVSFILQIRKYLDS